MGKLNTTVTLLMQLTNPHIILYLHYLTSLQTTTSCQLATQHPQQLWHVTAYFNMMLPTAAKCGKPSKNQLLQSLSH